MVDEDFKDLTRRTPSDKILHNKAFNIAKNPKYNGYQRDHASMVYRFLDKEASVGTVKSENISNEELAEESHKPIIKKNSKKRTITFCRQYLGCISNLIKEFVF